MFFFTKSQPKVDQPIETMIFSTEEDPDGVIIKTSLLHSTAEEPNELENDNSQIYPSLVEDEWGMDWETHGISFGSLLQADLGFERDTEDILYNDERKITDGVGAATPACTYCEEEAETETVSEGENDSDDEDNEPATPKAQETPEIETVLNETEENPKNTEDGDSGDKPVAGPEAAAAFWKRTDRHLAKMFSTCINKWSFLGLGLRDPTFEITADADDLSPVELLQFLESWDGSLVKEERATELCTMVLGFEDWRRERLEKLIRRELEDVGWEVESFAFDWNKDCDVLILNWKIGNMPKE
jgi:hypothetical protein